MKMESAVRSGASNLKGNKKDDSKPPHKNASNINCFNCGSKILGSITNYKSNCPAKTEQMVNVRRKAISKRFVVVYQLILWSQKWTVQIKSLLRKIWQKIQLLTSCHEKRNASGVVSQFHIDPDNFRYVKVELLCPGEILEDNSFWFQQNLIICQRNFRQRSKKLSFCIHFSYSLWYLKVAKVYVIFGLNGKSC